MSHLSFNGSLQRDAQSEVMVYSSVIPLWLLFTLFIQVVKCIFQHFRKEWQGRRWAISVISSSSWSKSAENASTLCPLTAPGNTIWYTEWVSTIINWKSPLYPNREYPNPYHSSIHRTFMNHHHLSDFWCAVLYGTEYFLLHHDKSRAQIKRYNFEFLLLQVFKMQYKLYIQCTAIPQGCWR